MTRLLEVGFSYIGVVNCSSSCDFAFKWFLGLLTSKWPSLQQFGSGLAIRNVPGLQGPRIQSTSTDAGKPLKFYTYLGRYIRRWDIIVKVKPHPNKKPPLSQSPLQCNH